MFNIEDFLTLNGYASEERKLRRQNGNWSEQKTLSTQEFFTPYSIVKRMCDKVSDEQLGNS